MTLRHQNIMQFDDRFSCWTRIPSMPQRVQTFVSQLRRAIIVVGIALLSSVTSGFAQNPPETISISLPDYDRPIIADLYKPDGPGPFPLMIFSHGRAGAASDRAQTNHTIAHSHPDYWLSKGFAILAPVRPGYGPTGGADVENSQSCSGVAHFDFTAKNAADVMEAVISWARTQSFVRKNRILLVGQSVGGMTVVALGARKISGVVGYINFAGGAGGDPDRRPMSSCAPEALGALYGEFGKTTTIPNLWLYSTNDLFWGPDAPVAWHHAFHASGGRGQFLQTGPVSDGNGHHLIGKGKSMWQGPVDAFLARLGFRSSP